MKIIEDALEIVVESYVEMLKTHVPSINDYALSEANQTYYFCNALVKILNEQIEENVNKIYAAASLEVPIKLNNRKKKIDGIVVSPSTNQIFYIETKRMTSGNKSRGYIYDDICKVKDGYRKDLKMNFEDENIVDEYVVILADLWLMPDKSRSRKRNEIPFWWCGKENSNCLEQFIDFKEYENVKIFFIDNDNTKSLKWSNKDNYIKRFIGFEKKRKYFNNYCLLAGSAKLLDEGEKCK